MKYILITVILLLFFKGYFTSVRITAESNIIEKDKVKFTDVHLEAGIYSTGKLGHSATWVDVNYDGCHDLIATNTSLRKPPRTYLFINQCDGTFIDITKSSGIDDLYFKRSSSIADYDNDGNVDIVLGGIDVNGYPTLYQNIGEGEFVDVTEMSNLSGQGYSSNLTWADYNLDGFIDLFQSGSAKYLYKNSGNGRFEPVTFDSNIDNLEKNLSSLWLDYNNDNLPDLYLCNYGYNILYRNNGDETFTDVTEDANLKGDKDWRTSAACSADYNNDGFFDLYVVNISSNRKALYKNNGDGTFTDVTEESGTGDVGDGRTCSFIDYNSDGLIDIFTTNHIRPSKLYRNNGDGTFTNMAFKLGLDRPIDIFSATWGDFNGDAILDVFLNGHIGIALYKGFNLNNSIIIELVGNGIDTNTSAIGSRIKLTSAKTSQIKEVSGGKGCCENDMLPLHFGLGSEAIFDMKIQWTSGKTCNFEKLNAENERIYKVWEKDCEIFSY